RDFHVTGVQTCALPISDAVETHETRHLIKRRIGVMKRGDKRRFVPTQLCFDSAIAHKFLRVCCWLIFVQLKNHFDFDACAQRERSEEHTSELQSRENLV